MRMRIAAACAVMAVEVSGCAQSPMKATDPVDVALKTCGMGLSTQSSSVFKAAYEIAAKKSSADFSATLNQSIDTQEATVLKQLGDKSPESTKTIVEEIKSMRECVVTQSSALRPASRPELLEQCRLDVQHRISPPGPVQYGTLRKWTQLPKDSQYTFDAPVLGGYFDSGGTSGFYVRTKCDIHGGRLQNVVDLDPEGH